MACKVCEHPEIGWIDRAIKEGSSLSVLAARFVVDENALSRHRAQHVNLVEFSGGPDPASLIRALEKTKERAEDAYLAAQTPAQQVNALREVRQSTEALAKLIGAYSRPDARILQSLMTKVKGVIITGLTAYPDAREQLLRELEKLMQEADGG